MPVDASLVGREFPPTPPHEVTETRVAAFARAVGTTSPDAGGADGGGRVPPTYPIVVAFEAMSGFLAAERLDLHRIVHGEQRFAYERPVVTGDVLSAALEVTGLRQIGGNDIIGTTSRVTDAAGALVCTTTATLVHRGAA